MTWRQTNFTIYTSGKKNCHIEFGANLNQDDIDITYQILDMKISELGEIPIRDGGKLSDEGSQTN